MADAGNRGETLAGADLAGDEPAWGRSGNRLFRCLSKRTRHLVATGSFSGFLTGVQQAGAGFDFRSFGDCAGLVGIPRGEPGADGALLEAWSRDVGRSDAAPAA